MSPINSHKLAPQDENKIVSRLSFIGIGGNILLAIFKFVAGVIGNSGAMISDAVHSLSDVVATFIALIGVHFGKREPDEDHPYGHERLESVAAVILGAILIVTAVGIGQVGLTRIITGEYTELPLPGVIALIAAIVSIVVKEGMFWYTRHYARVIHSSAFEADAWHHRSDALSSVGALIGIGASMLGFPIMDPLASIVICILVFKVAVEIIIDAVKKMLDTSTGSEFEGKIKELVTNEPGVERIDMLRTRMFGDKVYADLKIAVDGNMSLFDAHDIAERVHNEIEASFPEIKDVMIHVNPMR